MTGQDGAIFFETLLGRHDGHDLSAHIWTLQGKHTDWVRGASDAIAVLSRHNGDAMNLYTGVSLAPASSAGERIKIETAGARLGMWADIDILHPAHKSEMLPPDTKTAMQIIDDVEVSPTMVVDTGHGVQAWG